MLACRHADRVVPYRARGGATEFHPSSRPGDRYMAIELESSRLRGRHPPSSQRQSRRDWRSSAATRPARVASPRSPVTFGVPCRFVGRSGVRAGPRPWDAGRSEQLPRGGQTPHPTRPFGQAEISRRRWRPAGWGWYRLQHEFGLFGGHRGRRRPGHRRGSRQPTRGDDPAHRAHRSGRRAGAGPATARAGIGSRGRDEPAGPAAAVRPIWRRSEREYA